MKHIGKRKKKNLLAQKKTQHFGFVLQSLAFFGFAIWIHNYRGIELLEKPKGHNHVKN